MKTILGVDIGGTKCMVCLGRASESGEIEILKKVRFETDSDNPQRSMERIADELANMLEGYEGGKPVAIGVSVGGYIDSKNGIIVSTPVIPMLKNYPIGEMLSKRFDAKAFVQNDANACALAEWIYGAGKGSENMVFLTCGTGLGGGLILGGKLHEGASSNAGEVGHIRLDRVGPVGCGKAGSFEGFCSGAGIAQFAKMRALEALQGSKAFAFAQTLKSIEQITAKTLEDAANAGDVDALQIFNEVGENLGKGLAILVDILNPDSIVIGSVFVRCENLLREPMQKSLNSEAQSVSANACKVLPAKLGDDIGLYAAFATAINGLNKK